MQSLAIEALERERVRIRKQMEQSLAEIDNAIATLTKEKLPQSEAVNDVKPGQYAQLPMKAAMVARLNELGGGPVSFAQLGADLRLGGVDLGARPERNLKICASNNKETFEQHKPTNSVLLRTSKMTLD
jgi:hypothetical protein